MSEPTHTPGPWGVDGLDREKIKVYSATGEVCLIYNQANPHSGLTSKTRQCNAHLIAASPEMLAALRLIVAHFGDPMAVARAAIKSATGKP